ncbi:HalOD1 output domain-containing protein [Natronobiforma cellulositropha]|uniref:HalOD1 output domain-containing protein n=1 Tax=Natronobiforma cellulositropha TaxID=1679076 RepID=UPI0021D5BA26|nr:HalOD1 output domain-containing protein [Natronobiforma cellulositropha]
MPEHTPADRLEHIGDAGGRPVYYDCCRGTYHTWYDDESYEPVSSALLEAVSSVLEVEVDDLETLYERIDPDALNALFHHWRGERTGATGSVSFRFARCSVTVCADGEIVIDPVKRTAAPA